MALSSLVLACHEPGPRLLLVEDVTPLSDLRAATPVSAFHGKGWNGKVGISPTPLSSFCCLAASFPVTTLFPPFFSVIVPRVLVYSHPCLLARYDR